MESSWKWREVDIRSSWGHSLFPFLPFQLCFHDFISLPPRPEADCRFQQIVTLLGSEASLPFDFQRVEMAPGSCDRSRTQLCKGATSPPPASHCSPTPSSSLAADLQEALSSGSTYCRCSQNQNKETSDQEKQLICYLSGRGESLVVGTYFFNRPLP